VASHHRLIFLIFFVIFIFRPSFCFGSVQIKNHLNVSINQTAIFEIMFWSDKEEEITFSYEINKPADVMIIPNPLVLSPNKKDGEMIIGEKTYNVSKVKILVIPRDEGRYEINLTTKTQAKAKGINVVDERKFKFILDVGEIDFEKKEDITKNIPSGYFYLPSQGKEIFEILILILIIVISVLIYKIS